MEKRPREPEAVHGLLQDLVESQSIVGEGILERKTARDTTKDVVLSRTATKCRYCQPFRLCAL